MTETRRVIEDERQPIEVDRPRPIDRVAYRPAAVRRISWGATFAGVVIALVIQPAAVVRDV